MSKIIIEYNPELSNKTQKLIKDNITPSMIAQDESTCQYEISMVADIVEGQGELANSKDLILINNLILEGVHYVEL